MYQPRSSALSRDTLTQKQRSVLEFIEQYVLEYKRSPFIREVQTGCQIASYKSVVDRLNALERKGYIKRTASKHRGIRVTRRAAELQAVAAGQAEAGGSEEPTTEPMAEEPA